MKGICFSAFQLSHQILTVATEKCSSQISVTGMFRGLEYPYFIYAFIGKVLLQVLQVGISVKEPVTRGFLGWTEEPGFTHTAVGKVGTFGRTGAEKSHDHLGHAADRIKVGSEADGRGGCDIIHQKVMKLWTKLRKVVPVQF